MNEIEDQIKWDEYLIEGTNTLKNKLNITDTEKLKEAENLIVRKKLAYLYLNPIDGDFDKKHLCAIHNFIFNEIYYFAGELRNCSMQKETMFMLPDDIGKNLELVLKQMNDDFDNNEINSVAEFAFKLAPHYYNLVYVHPFREGNGRCIRTFIRDFVVEKSKNKLCGPLDLDYTKIDKENLLMGTSRRYIYPSMLEVEFMKGLVSLEKNKNKM